MTSFIQETLDRTRGLRLKSLFSVTDQVSSATVGFLVVMYVGREFKIEGAYIVCYNGERTAIQGDFLFRGCSSPRP